MKALLLITVTTCSFAQKPKNTTESKNATTTTTESNHVPVPVAKKFLYTAADYMTKITKPE